MLNPTDTFVENACLVCGKVNEPQSSKCVRCGSDLSASRGKEDPEPNGPATPRATQREGETLVEVTCRKCGKANQPHYKFCLGCGAELKPPSGTPPVECPKCGYTNQAHYKFCLGCAADLHPICTKCGKTNQPHYIFCLGCGADLISPERAPAENTCLVCGHVNLSHYERCKSCGRDLSNDKNGPKAARPRPSAKAHAAVGLACPSCRHQHVIRTQYCLGCGFYLGLREQHIQQAKALELPLPKGFEYVHSHGAPGKDVPNLGSEESIRALHQRLCHSPGGAFLLTGFRGVGKTTVVAEAIRRHKAGPHDVIAVWVNAGRPASTAEVLYEIVRRLFEVLQDGGMLQALPTDTAANLVRAYVRTSMSIKQSRAESTSRTLNAEVSVDAALLAKLGVKASRSGTRSEQAALEASFLEYSCADVEHDFVRILELLNPRTPDEAPRRWWQFAHHSPTAKVKKLVVVIDELDKLTATEEGATSLVELLSGLKNVLSVGRVHFVLIGGVDLYYRYLEDADRGNSLYESVFGWHMYVPCSWDASRRLLEWLIEPKDRPPIQQLDMLSAYLKYASRGVTRRLIQELNALVEWTDTNRARIRIEGTMSRRIALHAKLETVLGDFLSASSAMSIGSTKANEDRWTLGSHYLIDWLLSRRERQFTIDQVLEWQEKGGVDRYLRGTSQQVAQLLDHFEDAKVLVRMSKDAALRTQIGGASDNQPIVYALAPWLQQELIASRTAEEADGQTAKGQLEPRNAASLRARDLERGVIVGGRYELQELLGQGGMGGVFKAWDRRLARHVAVKYTLDELHYDASLMDRFRREAQIIANANHPNIVRGIDILTEDSLPPLLVLELLVGETLRARLARVEKMPEAEIISHALAILSALERLREMGVCRIDLKPENIMLTHDDARPVLIDFGIAKARSKQFSEFTITATGVGIGTPLYMSPEQFKSSRDVDIRSDLYSLAVVMLEALAGRHPYRESSSFSDLIAKMSSNEMPLDGLEANTELRTILTKALRLNPDDRFASPQEFAEALRKLPQSTTSPRTRAPALLPAGSAV